MYTHEFVDIRPKFDYHHVLPFELPIVGIRDVDVSFMPDEEYFSMFTVFERFNMMGRAERCRTGTQIYGSQAFHPPCNRWMDCVDCFRYRAYEIYETIQKYMEQYPGEWRMVSGLSDVEAKKIARGLSICLRFPTYRTGVVILSPQIDGDPLPIDGQPLLDLASELSVTMPHHRISYRPRQKKVKREKKNSFYSPDTCVDDIAIILEERQVVYKVQKHRIDWVSSMISDVQIAYELFLIGKSVLINGIRILNPYASIFDAVRDGRASDWVDPSEKAYLDAISSKNKITLVA